MCSTESTYCDRGCSDTLSIVLKTLLFITLEHREQLQRKEDLWSFS